MYRMDTAFFGERDFRQRIPAEGDVRDDEFVRRLH